MKARLWHKGFTIVELVIVVVVVGIIAAITVVSYNGILGQNREKALEGDLYKAATQLHDMKLRDGSFPAMVDDFSVSNSDTTLTYSRSGDGFCIGGVNSKLPGAPMYVTDGKKVTKGGCPPLYMQTISSSTCPVTRTVTVDARDNRTYWVQLMDDGKCWMLTNLAYAGGGVNSYSDVRAISSGMSDTGLTYDEPRYYTHTNANPTEHPGTPSVSIDGGATSPQYGYHYNWCAAMGAQYATGACGTVATPVSDLNVSICPAGWRLPTGGSTGDIKILNEVINGGRMNTDESLRTLWLGQRAGIAMGVSGSGVSYGSGWGYYWTSTPYLSESASYFRHGGGSNLWSVDDKRRGMSVRCIAR